MNDLSNPYYYDKDGKEYFFEEQALAHLLNANVCFINERDYYYNNKKDGSTIVVFVSINDVFVPAADALDIKLNELKDLYDRWVKNNNWGVVKWAAVKLNLKPQKRVVEKMKELGVWDEEMEGLKENL